jgi:hypothetical protein
MSTQTPVWGEEALKKIEKAPFFVRKLARDKVEKAAKASGITEITAEFVDQVRGKNTPS